MFYHEEIDEEWLQEKIEKAYQKRLSEEQTWPSVTDFDKLTAAFDAIAMTYDGKITRLYYNGQPDGAAATTGRIATSDKGLEIGTYQWGQPTPYYEGTIDNVRIYKRALDASEIVSLFEEYR